MLSLIHGDFRVKPHVFHLSKQMTYNKDRYVVGS